MSNTNETAQEKLDRIEKEWREGTEIGLEELLYEIFNK